ncbi:MAG: hypothetical protein LKM41_03075 [Lachnospiraceae bacterium]|jgi:hypothetical protein|nr:hypothetical protein [Lachnospiraceae bacterium]
MRTEIFALLIIVIVLAVLFAAWLFMIAPRVNHPGWEFLGKFRYAHRGLHSLPDSLPCIPENSLPAFALAAEKGFGAELDVHFTKDLQLAVVHDSNLKRVTGEDVRVEDLTAEEMRRLHLMGTEEKNSVPRRSPAAVCKVRHAAGRRNQDRRKKLQCADRCDGRLPRTLSREMVYGKL